MHADARTNMKTLRVDQQEARRFVLKRAFRAGLFIAPGVGKTFTTIMSVRRLVPVLVICRRDDFKTWREELHDCGITRPWEIESGTQPLPTRREAYHEGVDWFLVTYDLIKQQHVFDWVQSYGFRVVVLDECHLIKRWAAKRTKRVYAAVEHIPRRLLLTGSPITNDVRDVWSYGLFIDDGRTFGKKEYWFLKEHYIQEGHAHYLRRGHKDLIKTKLAKIAIHVHEDDVLRLPPIRGPIAQEAPMTGMQRRYYERAVREWEIELENGEVYEIDHVTIRVQKLRQIASGFYYEPKVEPLCLGGAPQHRYLDTTRCADCGYDRTTHSQKAVWLRSGKLEMFMRMAQDPDYFGRMQSVVCWCAHVAEIKEIVRRLRAEKISAAEYRGGIPAADRERIRNDFLHGKIKWFVGQADAGVGMNELVSASDAVYFSNSHRVVSRQQSMRRIRRIGSERHARITYWDLVSAGTIDNAILHALKGHMSVATYILDGLKRKKPLRRLLLGDV